MEQKSVADFVVLLIGILTFLIAFLKAILIPVASASVIVAFVIDHLLKRLAFWKDGWGGYASLFLNMLFSAGLFLASQAGQSESYLQVIGQLSVLLTLILSVGSGFIITAKTHQTAVELGIGKSLTNEEYEKKYLAQTAESVTVSGFVNDGPATS